MSESRVVEVYRAKNATQAHMLATALEEAGIKAEVQGQSLNTLSLTAVNLISDSPLWWAAPRILAGQLLFEFEARERVKAQETEGMPPIDAVCENCGRTCSFPAAQGGSVQACPQCGGYIDVGDEDSSDDDWGEAEGEDILD
jgi:hypothetical protein